MSKEASNPGEVRLRLEVPDLLPNENTGFREVILPIERKEYRTDTYYAVIEGYRPHLVQMETFQETRYLTEIETRVQTVARRPRWGLGFQAGYGVTAHGPTPYLGVGLQYNLITF